MLAVRDHLDRVGADVEVVLVTFTTAVHAARYVERHGLALPVLLDPDRSVYRSYGLGRGTTARVWSPRVVHRYYQIIRRNGFGDLQRATEDTRQLGGDFIIDPRGILTYGFWGAGPDQRPQITELSAAIQAAD